MKPHRHLFALLTSILFLAITGVTLNSCKNNEDETSSDQIPVKKKTILFIAGHPSHANGEHEFRAGCMILADALNASGLNLEAKVHYYGWPEDETIFDDVDACIIYADAGGKFGKKYAFLDKKVKEDGMGIMFMHYGVHPKKAIGEKYFKPWIGGYMDDHISVNPHWIADVKAITSEQVSRGLEKPFTVYDEFYFNMEFLTKEECDCCRPLAVATPSADRIVKYINMWNKHGENNLGKEQSLMWCRDPKTTDDGKLAGRGVGFVGGHYHRNWAIDEFRKLILNTIVWTARMEVPEGGVTSKPLTKEEINANLDRPNPNKPIELPTDQLLKQKPMVQPWFDQKGKRHNGGNPKQKKTVSTKKDTWPPTLKPAIVDLEHFAIPNDSELEVTVWAKSPMLYNPTNMDIDAQGRIWVAEAVNYRRKGNRRPDGDRIIVLQDTTGDGQADKSHTFVQDKEIKAPLGVSVFDNKIVVPMPPNLLVYTDVDRNLKYDPKIDKKEILMSGFNALQHDHSLHSVTHGPDGKWYFNNGNCGAIFTDKSGKTFNMNGSYRGGGGTWFEDNNKLSGKKSDDGFLWTSGFSVRVNPDGTDAEITGHGYRNSYEHSVNSLGDIFQNDNDDVGSCRNSYILEYGSAGFFSRDGQRNWRTERRPGQSTSRAHWRQDDPGTFDAGDIYGQGSPTGNVFYENGALGKKWEGTYLACEAAKNTIFGYKPTAYKATYTMDRFDFITSNVAQQYLGGDFGKRIPKITKDTSQTILFRPSDIAVGPDGAIYVTDWYDGRVGGHATIDDSCSGAIYRIAPKGFKSKVPSIDLTTIAGQIEALKSPAVNVRHSGFTRLRDGGENSFEAVLKLSEHENKYISSRAIWLLPHLGEKGMNACVSLLKSNDTDKKLVAYRALRRTQNGILKHAKTLASDPSDAIRRDVALSLRHHSAEETKEIFIELAKHVDITDKNSIEAIGLGAENKENAIWLAIKSSQQNQSPEQWTDRFTTLTWRLWPSAAVPDLTARAISDQLSPAQQKLAVESIAFIDHKSAAEAMFTLADETSPVKNQARYWLLKRGIGSWAKFNIQDKLKKSGIYDPEKIVIQEAKLPEPPKQSKLPPVADILKLKGDPQKGKLTMMRCIQCHSVNGAGVDYGPILKGWGSTQSREAIINAIRNPSGDIAHGFRGQEIITHDDKIIHGLATAGDPTVVISIGGVTQMIPKNKIKSKKYIRRSLMLSADQLGLSAQDIADITSYMQQWK